MTTAVVLVPALLGLFFLAAGLLTYRRDLEAGAQSHVFGLVALGPVFVAASLAAFAGEHFTAARSLAQLVPKWLPDPVLIAYFVGAAHLSAALSFVSRRYIRWSAPLLAIMFGLFVLLMDLPGAMRHPAVRIFWSLAARQATFAVGALALLMTEMRRRGSPPSETPAAAVRIWTAAVLVFYGIEQLVAPQFAPGVPSTTLTAAWVPLPHVITYATGLLLIAFGITMLIERYGSAAAASAGLLMLLLTLALYVPQFFLAHTAPAGVTAVNFIFDTLLFAGTLFVISGAIPGTKPVAVHVGAQVA